MRRMPGPPVLVVGAGPVGLTAANSLARFGIPVRIIDSKPVPRQLSKALVTWRRSLHTLDALIPHERWMEQCRHVSGLALADCGAIFATLSMAPDDPVSPRQSHLLPPGVLCTQAQIEVGLAQHLQDTYGITVERSTQLESFSVDEATGVVHCRLSKTATPAQPPATPSDNTTSQQHQQHEQQQQQQQHQQTEDVVASYLLGCDGARSAVRRGLGVPFPGFSDPTNRFLMVDCTYQHQPGINSHAPSNEREGQPVPDGLLVSTTPVGILGCIPLVDAANSVRLVWNAGRDGPAQPTLDDFQAVVLAHTRLQIKLLDVLWMSEFSVNERLIESYVHNGGRVLLAGDAAHVHSPAGGQGMNTGIQDATNLAWKVALAVSGGVDLAPKLLQTYHEERHPAGEAAVRFSGRLLRANAVRSPVARFVRRLVLSVVTRIPALCERFISAAAEDTVSYTRSSLARAAAGSAAAKCAGTAFPDVAVSIGGVMRPATDVLRGGERGSFGTLVLLTPGSSSGDQVAADWPSHWGCWPLHVVSVARQGAAAASEGGAVDEWGRLSASVGGADGVLVRPDGIIAVAGGAGDVRGWFAAHGMMCS